ncbi:KAP family P-loop NTPase fold protein [Candidatus Spongiihabitans sp.]|uniref:KAP family P-loop NTPase fold protein n=1 Tax=Candidatus Spongiihabitans sp. TaxID=3101308 RepID=UPI003C7E5C3B
MNQTSNNPGDSFQTNSLKAYEPEISPDDIWGDDALGREQIAQSLTHLIEKQTDSFVVSLHGDWGTGKTFLLKRWQETLKKDGFEAIYFNAWEDDFCPDPLVAIIGQLSEELESNSEHEFKVDDVKEKAELLFRKIADGLTKKYTGISLEKISETLKNHALDSYHEQIKYKNELRNALTDISAEVRKKTNRPLVFIIDELDRCRPLFAIELLERIKHIFDVPNMVFVLGVNRAELCQSLKSIYGEIDADVYFRRFFDMEFILPEADGGKFCEHLMNHYKVRDMFLGDKTNTNDNRNYPPSSFDSFQSIFRRLDLSLRDMDYCIRSIVFFGEKSRGGFDMYLFSLLMLAILRLKEPNLYREFIKGKCPVNEVLDCIDALIVDKSKDRDYEDFKLALLWSEALFYHLDSQINPDTNNAFDELINWEDGSVLNSPRFSKKTRTSNPDRIAQLRSVAQTWAKSMSYHKNFYAFAKLLELTETPTKKRQQ